MVAWVVHVVEAREEDVLAEAARPRHQTPIVRGPFQDLGRGRPLHQQEEVDTVRGRRLSLVADRGARRHQEVAGAEEGTTMITIGGAAQVARAPTATVAIVAGEVAQGTEGVTVEEDVSNTLLETWNAAVARVSRSFPDRALPIPRHRSSRTSTSPWGRGRSRIAVLWCDEHFEVDWFATVPRFYHAD